MKEILSPGDKIKLHRTKLNLTQEHIIDDTISKSLISMIEQDKRNLTERTAKIIAGRLNKYYESMGQSGQTVTPENLMETEEEQMKRLILENIG